MPRLFCGSRRTSTIPSPENRLARVGEKLDDTLVRRFKSAGVKKIDAYDNPEAFLARRTEEVTDELVERLVRAGVAEIEVFSSAAFIPVRGSYEDLVMRRDWSQKPRLAADVLDPKTGEVIAEKGDDFDEKQFTAPEGQEGPRCAGVYGWARGESPLIKNTLSKDPTHGEADALHSIYSLVRPGEAPNLATARTALDRLFFNPKRYDLGRVGRHKVNHRLAGSLPDARFRASRQPTSWCSSPPISWRSSGT